MTGGREFAGYNVTGTFSGASRGPRVELSPTFRLTGSHTAREHHVPGVLMGTIRIALLAALSLLASAGPIHAWIGAVPRSTFGSADDVAVDGTGHVVVVGRGQIDGRAARFETVTGRLRWSVVPEAHHGAPLTVGIAANGDAIVAGDEDDGGDGSSNGYVTRLAAATGSALWRTIIATAGDDWANLVLVTSDDDVIVGAQTNRTVPTSGFTIARLDGATGAELWRHDVGGLVGHNMPRALGITPSGDVVAAGIVNDEGFLAIRLDGAAGTEEWRFHETGPASSFETVNIAATLAVDTAGDVLVGGAIESAGDDSLADATVVKLAGASGTEIWRHAVTDIGTARVVVSPAGAIVAHTSFSTRGLAPATGAVLWTVGVASFAPNIRMAGDGNAIISGLSNVYAIDALTGARQWSLSFGTGFTDFADRHPLIETGAGGDVAIAGELPKRPATPDIDDIVVGVIADRIAGTTLQVKQSGAPTVTTLTLKSKDPRLVASGPAGPGGDGLGDPTVGGATLHLVNPTSGEEVTIPLPAAGWRRRSGQGYAPSGYQYSDSGGAFGPCKAVSVKSGKKLTVSCRGTGVAFSLDEPTQGSLGVRLTLGSGLGGEGFRTCLLFGGTVVVDRPGEFKASAAPAPSSCPSAP